MLYQGEIDFAGPEYFKSDERDKSARFVDGQSVVEHVLLLKKPHYKYEKYDIFYFFGYDVVLLALITGTILTYMKPHHLTKVFGHENSFIKTFSLGQAKLFRYLYYIAIGICLSLFSNFISIANFRKDVTEAQFHNIEALRNAIESNSVTFVLPSANSTLSKNVIFSLMYDQPQHRKSAMMKNIHFLQNTNDYSGIDFSRGFEDNFVTLQTEDVLKIMEWHDHCHQLRVMKATHMFPSYKAGYYFTKSKNRSMAADKFYDFVKSTKVPLASLYDQVSYRYQIYNQSALRCFYDPPNEGGQFKTITFWNLWPSSFRLLTGIIASSMLLLGFERIWFTMISKGYFVPKMQGTNQEVRVYDSSE